VPVDVWQPVLCRAVSARPWAPGPPRHRSLAQPGIAHSEAFVVGRSPEARRFRSPSSPDEPRGEGLAGGLPWRRGSLRRALWPRVCRRGMEARADGPAAPGGGGAGARKEGVGGPGRPRRMCERAEGQGEKWPSVAGRIVTFPACRREGPLSVDRRFRSVVWSLPIKVGAQRGKEGRHG
jgi:hypothetical protein